MKEAFEGTVEKIIFQNGENGYSVFSFSCSAGRITAAGVLPGASRGRRYELEGEFRDHPRFGRQFAFTFFKEISPDSADSMASFLGSGVIKGVGPALAEIIVRYFGKDTADVIMSHPERLTEVPGIGKKKAAAITEGYREHKSYADLVMALSPYGISTSVCMRLFRTYGAQAAEVVRQDPYRLAEEAEGFGFQKADAIAMQMGMAPDDPKRIRSAVIFALNSLSDSGSTFAKEDEFTEDLASRLDVSREAVSSGIFDLIMDGLVVKEKLGGTAILMHWYLHELEQQAAGKLFALAHAPLPHISGSADYLIKKSEKETGISLSERQKQAVVSSLQNGVSVITGGPGTGKTTIINMLLAVLEGTGIKTLLAAPTGRAAKRMSQATGHSASTIHRLLEAAYIEGEDRMHFMKDEDDPLDCGCLIVDEMSMVDLVLLSAMLAAVKPGTRLIMVGDADQLPSVGPGSVLKDIIGSDTIHSIRLTEIFRQASESAIITNAHAVNRGEYPVFNEKNSDFFFMEKADQREALELIKELCSRRLPAFYSELDPFSDIQVLTPTKKELLGSRNLNRELQAVLNPPSNTKEEITFGAVSFREGDKVIQTKNDYSLDWISMKDMQTGQGVFNGDIGIVRSIDKETGKLTVIFDDERLVNYDISNADELDMAYALTVHKSQGCEFPVVVMPVSVFMPFLTTRNLFYTAITRAKQAVVLVGRSRICYAMVDNNSVEERNSGLGLRLRRLWDYEYSDEIL